MNQTTLFVLETGAPQADGLLSTRVPPPPPLPPQCRNPNIIRGYSLAAESSWPEVLRLAEGEALLSSPLLTCSCGSPEACFKSCSSLYTWEGWIWILHLLHCTSSWSVINCMHRERRTDFVRVQVNYLVSLECTVWHIKIHLLMTAMSLYICISLVVQLKCSMFSILLSLIFLGNDVPPLLQVPGFLVKKNTQLYAWIIQFCVIEKRSGDGRAPDILDTNTRRIRCSVQISSEIINKCFV